MTNKIFQFSGNIKSPLKERNKEKLPKTIRYKEWIEKVLTRKDEKLEKTMEV